MVQKQRVILALAVSATAASLSVSLSGCGGGGGGSSSVSTPSVRSYQGTQASGDAWNWNLTTTSASFTATDSATGHTYSGSWAVQASGFDKLIVIATTDPNVAAQSAMYGVELPGSMFAIEPAGVNPDAVIGAGLASAPTGSLAYNYVDVPASGYNEATGDAFGTMNFSASSSAISGTVSDFNFEGTEIGTPTSYTLSVNNGLLGETGGSVTGGITSHGIAVLDFGPGEGGAAGVLAPTANINVSSVLAGNYRGFHMNPVDGSILVWGAPGSSGSRAGISLGTFSDVDTNAQVAGYGLITFSGQPSPGQLTGTVTYLASGGSGPVSANAVFAVNQVSGKYVLFGIVDYPGGPGQFVLVQQ